MQFQLMTEALLPAVMDIEQRAYLWPWTEGMFRDSLNSGYLCHALADAGQLLGYTVIYVAVGECHILNVCVEPEKQGLGLGRMLLRHTLECAIDHGADQAFLEVRPSNTPAIKLYESMGFAQVGRRRDYYPAGDQREDALVYQADLSGLARSK
ncbi:MAG TPA: ribosomal protein S18-alanine N-acetyltransferase [Dongiaceae bacterium]|nr:ribosomal protein S18-alanine N-acetyltransferase [Dongiaceae bacterium]